MDIKKENKIVYFSLTLIVLILLFVSFNFKQSTNQILGLPVSTCIDSDNGLIYDVAGYVTTNTNTYYDTCLSELNLKEAYCLNDIAYTAPYTCAQGCSAGKCISISQSSKLAISSVQPLEVKSSEATISWTTNLASNSQIRYGETTNYGQTTILDPSYVTYHSQKVPRLKQNTIYHYNVKSRDELGNVIVSEDYTFETPKLFPSPFGFHFSSNHEPNIIIANMFNEIDVNSARYDIILSKLNYTEIDEVLAIIPEDVLILATIQNSDDYPEYPENMESYLSNLTELVTKYKDRIKIWQISNEVYGGPSSHWWGTKEQYTVMLNNAYTTIKEADPNSIVLSSGIPTGIISDPNGWGPLPEPENITEFVPNPPVLTDEELEEMERESEIFLGYVWKYGIFDSIIDVHLYDYPDSINIRSEWLKGELEKYSLDKDIIFTETASIDIRNYGRRNPFTLEEERKVQAIELVQRYVYINLQGDLVGMWHKPYSGGEDTGSILSDIVEGEDLIKRPSYYTLELLTSEFDGLSSVTKLAEGQYQLIVNDQPVFVVWNPINETTIIDLSPYIPNEYVDVKYIVTRLNSNNNPIYRDNELMPTNAIIINEQPVIIKPVNVFVDVKQTPIQKFFGSIFG